MHFFLRPQGQSNIRLTCNLSLARNLPRRLTCKLRDRPNYQVEAIVRFLILTIMNNMITALYKHIHRIAFLLVLLLLLEQLSRNGEAFL